MKLTSAISHQIIQTKLQFRTSDSVFDGVILKIHYAVKFQWQLIAMCDTSIFHSFFIQYVKRFLCALPFEEA